MSLNSGKSLIKRIRRQVRGKNKLFFAGTPPGFEIICLKELKASSIASKHAIPVKGGIEFQGRLTDCYSANLELRTANRILMRITSFKATNFHQLLKKVMNTPWELYLFVQTLADIKIAAHHSRLFHTKAVADYMAEGIAKRLKKFGVTSATSFPQNLYVRIIADRFFISLDSTGKPLYQRGFKENSFRAPIRETLAAGILKIADFSETRPLLDPMCGSGTFSMEAAMLAKNIAPGLSRNFAFSGWPVFSPRLWAYLKQQAKKTIKSLDHPLIHAGDENQDVCRALNKSLDGRKLSDAVNVYCVNFLDFSPRTITNQPGLVVLNPPYGRRIGTKDQSKKLFLEIFNKLQKDYPGWHVALLVYDRLLLKQISFKYSIRPIFHGGLNIRLITGRLKK